MVQTTHRGFVALLGSERARSIREKAAARGLVSSEGKIADSLSLLRDYLGSALPGLDAFPFKRIAELTPGVWVTRK